jgi:hypothetical protein
MRVAGQFYFLYFFIYFYLNVILYKLEYLVCLVRDEWTIFSFPSSILLLAPKMSLLTGLPDSTGDCQSTLVDKLEVSPNRHHHTMALISHPGMKDKHVEAAVLRSQSHSIITNLPTTSQH